jgi:hypothetical protein
MCVAREINPKDTFIRQRINTSSVLKYIRFHLFGEGVKSLLVGANEILSN